MADSYNGILYFPYIILYYCYDLHKYNVELKTRYRGVCTGWFQLCLVAQSVKNLPAMRRPGFNSRVEKIPWRRKWQPTPVFLPGESHGQRSLAVHGVARVRQDLATKLLLLSQYLSTFVSILYQISCSLASVRTSPSSLFFFKGILIILDPLHSFITHTKITSQTKNC